MSCYRSVILEESGEKGTDDEATNTNKYKQILSLKEVHFIAAFALIYVGVEVTMGGTCFRHPGRLLWLNGTVVLSGWSVTYILEERHGSSSSGYIASGFFGGGYCSRATLRAQRTYDPRLGLMLGRVSLMWLNKMVRRLKVIRTHC